MFPLVSADEGDIYLFDEANKIMRSFTEASSPTRAGSRSNGRIIHLIKENRIKVDGQKDFLMDNAMK